MRPDAAINVLVLEPGQVRATLRVVPPGVDALRHLVGGWVEALTIGPGTSMFLNADGKSLGLPVNGAANRLVYLADPGLHPSDYVVGTVVVAGEDGSPERRLADVSTAVLTMCARAGVEVDAEPVEH